MDLYRVGEPSVGETWPNRFRSSRSTGGLGAGVYAFRDEWAAKRNESGSGTNDGVFVLENALENPLQPETREATDELHRLSRAVALLAEQVHVGNVTFDEALEGFTDYDTLDEEIAGESEPRYTITGGFGGSPGVNTEEADTLYSSHGLEILFNTPGLYDRYGYDNEALAEDFIRAGQEAYNEIPSGGLWWDNNGVQPINKFLSPEFDGIAPLDGAGGNTGYHGCVVFKEKVDRCVGRDTDYGDRFSAEELNACWGGGR